MNTYTITFTGTRKASRCIAKTIVEDVQADDAQAATLKLSEHYADITVIDILWNTPIKPKAAYTPGPWVSGETGDEEMEIGTTPPLGEYPTIITALRTGLFRPDYPEQKANAVLITAAPELVAAVKEAKQYLEDVGEIFLDLDGDPQSGCQKMIDILDAALAKAGAQ